MEYIEMHGWLLRFSFSFLSFFFFFLRRNTTVNGKQMRKSFITPPKQTTRKVPKGVNSQSKTHSNRSVAPLDLDRGIRSVYIGQGY